MATFVKTASSVNNTYQSNICNAEDRFTISETKLATICAVFDGHAGDTVSDFLSKNLAAMIQSKISGINISDNDAIRAVIIECFQKVDTQVFELIKLNRNCGSTCTMVIKIENKLVLINLGDSNLILYKNGIKSLVMKEHLYSNPEEKERIDALVKSGILSLNSGHAPKILNNDDVTTVADLLAILSVFGTICE